MLRTTGLAGKQAVKEGITLIYMQATDVCTYRSTFLSGLCRPVFGTALRLLIKGAVSADFVSAAITMGSPFKGSGMVRVFLGILHSPFTKL
jgi:hypothetical protein